MMVFGKTPPGTAEAINGVAYRRQDFTPAGGVPTRILYPKSGHNGAVLIYQPGGSGNEASFEETATGGLAANFGPLAAALLGLGYVIVTASQSVATAGTYRTITDSIAGAIAEAEKTHTVSHIDGFGMSTGALFTAAALTQHTDIIGRSRSHCSLVGLWNLAAWHANGNYNGDTNTGFDIPASGTYAAQTAGYDPALYPQAELETVRRWHFVYATGDTFITVADHYTDANTELTGATDQIERSALDLGAGVDHGDFDDIFTVAAVDSITEFLARGINHARPA